MRIRNQFLLSIAVFTVILVIVVGSVFATTQQTTQLNNQAAISEDIQTRAGNLVYLSSDYFLYQESSALSLWQTEFSLLSADISTISVSSPQEKVLLENIKGDAKRLEGGWKNVVSYLENAPRNVSVRVLPAFQADWSIMSVQNQVLIFDAQQLSQALRIQIDQLNMTGIILIIVLLGLFGAYFVTNYLITYRNTLKSIAELQTGIAFIGSGNLEYSLKGEKNDEVGAISNSVNQMAANLKAVTASKADLEKEISERKKVEDNLRKSEQRWSTTLSSIGDSVIATDLTGNVTFMNAVAEELTGWTASEALGKSLKQVFHIINEETHLGAESPIAKVLKEGMVVGLANHTILVRKDGFEIPLDDSAAPIKDENGSITGVILVFHDITERKELEKETQRLLGAVQEERDRLSSLLNSINDEVWFADTEKKFTLANPSAIKEFKLGSSEDVDVENLAATSEVYRPDGTQRPIEEAPPLRALKGEVLKNQEEIVKTPASGELRYRQVSSAPVRDGQGNIIGSISVVRDITELKQLQNSLQNHAADLEKLVEERTKQLKDAEKLAAIGATAGMVGHDIRNPLQAITSDVYLAKSDLSPLPDSEGKRNALEGLSEIEKNVLYINKIVQDLQDYARPINPVAKETNLRSIIDGLLKKNSLPDHVKVHVKVQKEAATIMTDPEIVRRVLANLVNNAVQAMPEGGKLDIQVYQESNGTFITIKDTGVGIPEEVKSKLFTPLFTTKSKGQGFGLAVVKRLTEALGGTVTFESQEGNGTTFIVRLPQKTRR